ncbi:MAG: hypothetical protein L0J67_07280 [Halomonas sp.]|nr:hypothetical protein [Halomonas sp.]MDN6336429.1 hypothetical protein [Halomonas sp.]
MSEGKPPARRKSVPLAPAGDEAFAPLYDLKMRWPVRRAWLQLMIREGVQATMGLPLEHALMGAWLKRLPGRRLIERLGLPRRALEQTLGDALVLHVAPRELIRGVRRSGLPDRQRPSSMTFIWSGEWDQYRSDLRTGSRYSLIRDLAAHRDSLTDTRRFHALAQRLAEGHPWRSHQQGVLLDSHARILIYLRAYLGFLDDMAKRGFDAERGKDALGWPWRSIWGLKRCRCRCVRYTANGGRAWWAIPPGPLHWSACAKRWVSAWRKVLPVLTTPCR